MTRCPGPRIPACAQFLSRAACPEMGKRKGVVLSLVRPTVSADTVKAAEYLLQEARAGRVIGLAWVALQPGYGYEVDWAGEVKRDPTFTRGTLKKLDDEVSAKLRDHEPDAKA